METPDYSLEPEAKPVKPKRVERLPSLPKTWNTSKKHEGELIMAGRGNGTSGIMAIGLKPDLSDMTTEVVATQIPGRSVREAPMLMKGPAGALMREIVTVAGIDPDSVRFTTLVKWYTEGGKPSAAEQKHGWPLLVEEIREQRPLVLVALDKDVFDRLTGLKLSKKEIKGGWLYSEEFDCPVYLSASPQTLLARPSDVATAHGDWDEIVRMTKLRKGVKQQTLPLNYRLIDTLEGVKALAGMLERDRRYILSVDCEWKGVTHMSGELRSLAIAWAPGQAAVIRFTDCTGRYRMDAGYKEVGEALSVWLDRPDVAYVGHHIAADLPWMHTWLGLAWYRKVYMDTEFALQVIDEHSPGSLERLSLALTDLGAYSIPLTVWRKKHKVVGADGFGSVPDSIIVEYAAKDVDVPLRAVPQLHRMLEEQDLLEYYHEIVNPMVTDVFTNFAILGLPTDRCRMDELRDLYHYVEDNLAAIFRRRVQAEAVGLMEDFLASFGVEGYEAVEAARAGDVALLDELMPLVPREYRCRFDVLGKHLVASASFNIRATQQLRNWLFVVKGLTPVKTTGKPAMAWSKVMELPEKDRSIFSPAVDKQTLQILAAQTNDQLLQTLLQLNACGNIVKMFLPRKGKARDKGLHHWLASDGRVHNQYSTTETGRPRAWNPNVLNWTSNTNDLIEKGVAEVLRELLEQGTLKPRYKKYFEEENGVVSKVIIPSLRSFVRAPAGWCFVESDFKTAEIRGLAFISNDASLIRLMTEDDTDFVSTTKGPARVNFPRWYMPKPEDLDLIMSVWENNKQVCTVDESMLLKTPDGGLIHPPHDLHWALAEQVNKMPRERLNKKRHRDPSKVVRFSSTYGATAEAVERKIESDTKIKPEPGEAQSLLDALAESQPFAQAFLEAVERAPSYPGWLRTASGRVRRFLSPPTWLAGSGKLIKNFSSGQGREARNFFPQESVAATLCRSLTWLLDYYIARGMMARPVIGLYDAILTLCPIEERFLVREAHQKFMDEFNTWKYHGRIMSYPIDTDFVMAWSEDLGKVSPKAASILEDPEFRNDPVWVKKTAGFQG